MKHAHEIIKGVGIDFVYISTVILAWLPILQGLLGVCITVIVLLININRLKKEKLKNNENEKQK